MVRPANSSDPFPGMKLPPPETPAIGRSPIQQILLVKRSALQSADEAYFSLPGHMLHFFCAGEAELTVNGRGTIIRTNTLIWHHNIERVETRILERPLIFYSVHFMAESLPPPPVNSRVFVFRTSRMLRNFREMVRVWSRYSAVPVVRTFRCHALLLEILARLSKPSFQNFRMDAKAELWWRLESEYLSDLNKPVSLESLARYIQRAPRTIARSCLHAVGKSPMKRVRELRMDMARGLLKQRELSISEVAYRVGYGRIHEFSRDYHRYFGCPPSKHRMLMFEENASAVRSGREEPLVDRLVPA